MVFKIIISKWCQGPKDLLALLVTITWCISIFLPEMLIDEVTQRSFERILLMIIGFYFGSHKDDIKDAIQSDKK